MMKTYLFALLSVIAVAGFSACTPTANSSLNTNANGMAANNSSTAGNAVNSVSNTISNAAAKITTDSPDEFMKDAAAGGMAEVEIGKLAVSKAQDPEVKKFGQMMVDDHSKANAELKALAAKKNITLPADIGSHQSTLDDLKALSGAEFDREYVEEMVDDHESDVSDFQQQAENGADAEVKAWAAKTLPVLKKHLEAIKAIQAKMK